MGRAAIVRRSLGRYCVISFLEKAWLSCAETLMNMFKRGGGNGLKAAAVTFESSPKLGVETDSATGVTTTQIFGPLQTTVVLLNDGETSMCFISTACYADFYPYSNLLRERVGAILGLKREQISVFSTHNHSCPVVTSWSLQLRTVIPQESVTLREDQLTDFGRIVLQQLQRAARGLRERMVPVNIAWAVGRERRISYNRKGRRADGSTYFMRDEERVLLGADFCGDIDDDAPVVAFLGANGKPVCFIVQFTAHPVTAYHPESPVTFGDFAQVASDDLSLAHGGVPVLFLQGCAGESNSKLFLLRIPAAERVANATRLGHQLGETYIAAAGALQSSKRSDLGFAWQSVFLPFTKVPSERRLRADLAVVEDFLKRVSAGDDQLLTCLGINAARSMSLTYRMKLVEPFRRWLHWALRFHTERRLQDAPKGVAVTIGAFRIGDIGFVGMPCEPLLGIGRQIRAGGNLSLTIPVGYMNDDIYYVPDAPNLGDFDYQSAYYRYTDAFLPFRKPGGDLLAKAGLRALHRL